ncbi:iron uptake transporter deferrochelatase/peroxidase subunit [Cohnella sp. REN36]|uniref:iron uptake transporter deferrochelatase/peroxidase subunit n=1 Tax=Cohnella sp. REN36 TaxID=2887347 RepID=UPI001D15A4D7|nr:iron uptake transporter deferrochelatase/peroxidase subunit [Cohnella sp. REN36]MCC3371653.1 iron uptake transporter deferrochelatase/peroxidase subunit [Cohnella sp. REN36]
MKREETETPRSEGREPKLVSRRDVLKMGAVGGLGLLIGVTGIKGLGLLDGPETASAKPSPEAGTIPFYGAHQAGVVTPMQDYVCMGAFDLTTGSVDAVRKLFKMWTEASARFASGEGVGDESGSALVPPADTGETIGLLPARATLTFGLGASFFDGRYGLASKRPEALADIPAFKRDELVSEWSHGDVIVQVCANDPQVAFHAIRNLARIARGKAVLRWMQQGYQRSGLADPKAGTPRNLLGFKDGTNNPNVGDADVADDIVWAKGADGAPWMDGGSYMVVRRIRMRIEVWDRTTLGEQEATFGRHRDTGAPLGQAGEFDTADYAKAGKGGKPLIPGDSHMALASMGGKVKIHRRGYSYTNGIDLRTGQLDAGLLFICYNRDPRKQFIPMQEKLAASDRLNEYIQHVGSGIYAVLPGVREGGSLGDSLW